MAAFTIDAHDDARRDGRDEFAALVLKHGGQSSAVREMVKRGDDDASIAAASGWPLLHVEDARRILAHRERCEHVANVRRVRANMRAAFHHARSACTVARRTFGGADYARNVRTLKDSHAHARRELAFLRELRAKGADVPRGMLRKEAGTVWANQGMRDAECLAVRNGRALVSYIMPNGRIFYWDVPAACEWHELRHLGKYAPGVRNVSAENPPAAWREVIRKDRAIYS